MFSKADFEKKVQAIFESNNTEFQKIYEKFKDKPEVLQTVLSEVVDELYEELNPYRIQPVSTAEWLSNPYYCGPDPLTEEGIAKDMFPKLKEDFNLVHNLTFPFREAILSGGIGYGKSFFMSLGLIWNLYFLSTLKSPQSYFGLAKSAKIAIMIISITEKQAKSNMFSNIKSMIKQIPYFKETFMYNEKKEADSIIFPNNIELFSGTSTQSSTIGLNIFSAALDEANFFKAIKQSKRSRDNTGEFDEALTLYTSLVRRQESRFLKHDLTPGILYLGSSNVYPDDFTSKRARSAKASGNTKTFIMDTNVYTVNREAYSKEEFIVELGGMNKRNRILEGNETDIEGELIHIPMDFIDAFKKDLDNAIRDIAGKALYSVSPFFGERQKIHAMFDESIPRIFTVDRATLSPKSDYELNEHIVPHIIINPNRSRYIAMDIGLKKDRFGFCMGYIDKFDYVSRTVKNEMSGLDEVVREKRIFMTVEFVLQLYPEIEFGEVELGRVRHLIYQLKKFGYKIRYSSADGFQSKDMDQILRRNGIKHTYISMDKTTEPYETFRSAVYEGRVRCQYHPTLEKELVELEKDYVNDKVNHPKSGSKDIADAVGQLCYNMIVNPAIQDEALLPSNMDASVASSVDSYESIIENFNKYVRGG